MSDAHTEESASGVGHALRAFRHREFRIFWGAALVSNAGQWLQNLTIPFVLFRLTGSEAWIGLATFVQFIPGVLLGPTGGALADRYERRRVLIFTQIGAAGVALAMWGYWSSGGREPVAILALTAGAGLFNGINIPSWQAFVPSLIPRDDLSSAITLNSVQFNLARALGPAIGGVVLARLGPGAAFLMNAMSFAFVLTALVVIGRIAAGRSIPATTSTTSIREGFIEALSYIRTQTGIYVSILTTIAIGLFGMPVIQFVVVYADELYKVDTTAFGFLSAATGIGAIAAAPIVSGMFGEISRATIVRWALPVYAVAIFTFGISPNYTVGFIALIVAGAGFLAIVATGNTAVQSIVTDRLRGRVISVRVMLFTLALPIGGLVQGLTADAIGARPVVAAAGIMLVGASIVFATRPDLLARLDDPPDNS